MSHSLLLEMTHFFIPFGKAAMESKKQRSSGD